MLSIRLTLALSSPANGFPAVSSLMPCSSEFVSIHRSDLAHKNSANGRSWNVTRPATALLGSTTQRCCECCSTGGFEWCWWIDCLAVQAHNTTIHCGF
jgi:hypothetical protein